VLIRKRNGKFMGNASSKWLASEAIRLINKENPNIYTFREIRNMSQPKIQLTPPIIAVAAVGAF